MLRYLVIVPLIEMIRAAVITLICLSAYNYGLGIDEFGFVAIVIVITTIVVLADVVLSGKATSCIRGKLSPLEERDPVLLETINQEWAKLSGSETPLNCFVMEGESGHSNCFVDSERVVIYDSMFEHLREREHMMGILRHEMGHSIHKDVSKIVLMRVLYYNLLFVGFIFLLKTRETWLPMFGVTYDSLFLAVFILMHFIHFKIAYYIYEVIENTMQRQNEFSCDNFAT